MTKYCKVTATLALFFSALIASAATTPPKVVFIGDQFTYLWGTTPGAFSFQLDQPGLVRPDPAKLLCDL